MKITKTASGKHQIKISKKDWQAIGKKAGWIKKADLEEFALPDFGDDFGGEPKQSYDPHKDEAEEIISRTEMYKNKEPHTSNKIADALADGLSYFGDLSSMSEPDSNLEQLDERIMPYLNFAFKELRAKNPSEITLSLIGIVEKSLMELKMFLVSLEAELKRPETETEGMSEEESMQYTRNQMAKEKVKIDTSKVKAGKALTALLNFPEINP
tara:strand:+ start:44552 stop:45187 length:636 start_codon:yes stop_codon:yes gene_type:complete